MATKTFKRETAVVSLGMIFGQIVTAFTVDAELSLALLEITIVPLSTVTTAMVGMAWHGSQSKWSNSEPPTMENYDDR